MNRISETDEFNDSPAIANNENGKKLSFNTLKKMYNTKFAKLKYGNNQELIFNIESKSELLLLFIAERFQETEDQMKSEIVDLVDTEGNLLNLRINDMRKILASTVIIPQSTYILVDTQKFPPSPMLKNSELLTNEFYKALEKLVDIDRVKTPEKLEEETYNVNLTGTDTNVDLKVKISSNPQAERVLKKKKSKIQMNVVSE